MAVRRCRVALVAPSLDILGGQGVQAETLRARLEADGHPVTFLPINPRFPSLLAPLRRLPYGRTLLNQALYVPGLRRLRGADVVHVFSAAYWSFVLAPVPAIAAARAFGLPVVLHYHSGEADDHLRRWPRTLRRWLRAVDRIVVPSEYLREVFAAHGYDAHVVPNIVDTSAFAFRLRSIEGPHVLSIRNLEPYYAIDDTIEAFAIVKARHPAATLTIAGVGSLRAALEQQVRRLGVSDVRFVGRVEPTRLPALFDRAEIFVNSSVLDNQPVSILEAFAAGLPVISTGTGDIHTMLAGGEAGIEVPPRSPEAMAEAISNLAADPQRARALAERARREVETFTWSRIAPAWRAIYDEVRPGHLRSQDQPVSDHARSFNTP